MNDDEQLLTDDQPEPDDAAEHPTQEDITEFFRRLKATVEPLRGDSRALKATDESDQRARRVYVRAVFAEIESTLDMYAQFLLLIHRDELRPEERMLLEEKEAGIDASGDVKLRPHKCGLRSRIKFIFKMVGTYVDGIRLPTFRTTVGTTCLQASRFVTG